MKKQNTFKEFTNKSLAVIIASSLLFQQTVVAAGVEVDTSANKKYQPTVEMAPNNKVPVINIVKPDNNGLSHNKFINYNVNKEGLILNNSNKTRVKTQLAGYIYGNKNFGQGATAKTILNEVTSKNRTVLRGYTEVAGDSARVIVANPNGIYINGAGFINTPRATITTGTPNFLNQKLHGFNVQKGTIEIEGEALNLSNVNKAEFYSKVVKLNTKINAQDIDIITGKNSITADGAVTKDNSLDDNKPEFSIDSTALGGIYANKINLIGTQKGVGVNLPVEIVAQDNLTINADGKIVLDKAISENKTEIKTQNLTNTGFIYGKNSLDITTNESLINKGGISSDGILTIDTNDLTNYNTIYSNGDINLYVKNNLLNKTDNSMIDGDIDYATIFAKNNINIQGDSSKTQRTNDITNDVALLETNSGDINIFANNLSNTNSDLVVEETTNGSYNINLKYSDYWYFPRYGDSIFTGISSGDSANDVPIGFVGASQGFKNFAISRGAYINLATTSSLVSSNYRVVRGSINEGKNLLYINGIGYKYETLGVNSIYGDVKYKPATPDGNSYIDYGNANILNLLREYYKGFEIVDVGSFPSAQYILDRILFQGKTRYVIKGDKNNIVDSITATRKNIERINKNNTDLSKKAKIVTGGNLNLDVSEDVKNYVSLISASKDINFQNTNTNLTNISETIGKASYLDRSDKGRINFANTLVKHDSTIEAGGNIAGEISGLNNEGIKKSVKEFTYGLDTTSKIKDTHNAIKLPTNEYGKFITAKPTEEQKYLIESNPLYTNESNFTGSDYFIKKMNYQATKKVKRLGDAAYETELVRQSIINQTGKRILSSSFKSDNLQYKKLMDNAINLSGIIDLKVGVAPTKEQLAQLTTDIVWMVEKTVNGEKVLVPQVYLANNTESDNTQTASIISQDKIDLKVANSVDNSGVIKAANYVSLDAGNKITNDTGVIISNGEVSLVAKNDIVNQDGGKISGSDVNIQSTNGSIENKTYTKVETIGDEKNSRTFTLTSNQSKIEATNGNLSLKAKEDITNIASNLSAKKDVSLEAQEGNITLSAAKIENASSKTWGANFDKSKKVRYLQSTINAGDNITLNSGKNINLEATKINTNKNINISAKEDVNITAVNNVDYTEKQRRKKSGFMGSKTTRDMSYKENVVSSNITGKNITIRSNESNVIIEAGKLKADENIVIDAKKNIEVIAKQYREGKLHYTKKSSWGGLSQSASMDRTDAIKAKEAKLQTDALNIILKSGNDIKILGSNIEAASDVQLQATNDILIGAVQELLQKEKWTKSSSFNPLSFVASLASFGVVNLGPIYEAQYKLNGEADKTAKSSNITSGKDINIDAGSAKVIGSNLDAAKDINATTDIGSIEVLTAKEEKNTYSQDKKIEVRMGTFADTMKSLHGLGGGNKNTKLKLTIAKATYDDIKKNAQATINKGSNVESQEGNIALDSTENINIVGSTVQANNGDISLNAEQNVNIKEAVDTTQSQTKETHAKAEISATVQNEYVEAAKAYLEVAEAAKQLKQTKKDYKEYKNSIKKLEDDLNTLKQELANKTPGVDKEDINEFAELISDIKSDEKYYLAAIAAATVNLTSKTTIAIQQTATATSSTGTYGFSAGISLDLTGSKTKTNTTETKSVASNLSGNNITIKTKTDLNNQTNISGSNLNAKDDLTIDTNELNVTASQDTSSTTSKEKDISGSVSMTMYGAASGPQVSLGYGQNNAENSSLTNNNSQINATNIKTSTTNDTNLKGANLNADELLSIIVGGNLDIQSLKDTYDAYQKGFNVSAGFGLGNDENYSGSTVDEQSTLNNTLGARTGNGKIASANVGYGASNSRTKVKQTVLSSVTGKQVDVKVGENTNLKGSMLAAGTYDENGNFTDNGNLNLETKTLTYQNSTNRVYDTSKSFNVSAGIGIGEKTNDDGTTSTTASLTNAALQYTNDKTYEKSKTLATLGQGNVTIQDTVNSDDTTALNRDTSKVQKDIYSAKTSVGVDITLDGNTINTIVELLSETLSKLKNNKLPISIEEAKKFNKTFEEKNPELYNEYFSKIEKGLLDSNLIKYDIKNAEKEAFLQILIPLALAIVYLNAPENKTDIQTGMPTAAEFTALGTAVATGEALKNKNVFDSMIDFISNKVKLGKIVKFDNKKINNLLNEINKNKGNPPNGYKGNSEFKNKDKNGNNLLPTKDSQGNNITYKEYDVNPTPPKGTKRDSERIVMGSDGKKYYTNDHYETFTEIK